jgi:aspartate aminotransferase
VSYPEQVRVAGATPRIIETSADDGYRVKPRDLEATVTERTKALILCSPSNPTGAAYAAEHLVALAEVAKKHHFYVITDEIYGQLVYGGFEQRSIIEVAPELRDRIIIVDGVSKTYAMTGFRIGWMLGPAAIAKACDTIQSQSTTNPTTVSQFAAIAALTGPQGVVEEMRLAFEARRDRIVGGLNRIGGIRCRLPEGAFYAFADVSALVGRRAAGSVLEDDVAVARYFLDEALCAVVPGTPFGAPGHVRLSYAVSMEEIEQGLSRMAAAVAKLG